MLSSPEVIIEGDHDYGDDLMMDMARWLCNHLLPNIGYEIVIIELLVHLSGKIGDPVS